MFGTRESTKKQDLWQAGEHQERGSRGSAKVFRKCWKSGCVGYVNDTIIIICFKQIAFTLKSIVALYV